MALYKQPYGDRMEELSALRKEGIFARLKAKKQKGNQTAEYKEYVKEEYKQAPDEKSSVSVTTGVGPGNSESSKYIANTGTGIDFSEVKNQGHGDFVTAHKPSGHNSQTDLTGPREGIEGMANIKDLAIQTGPETKTTGYLSLLNKPVGSRYSGKKLSLGVEGSFSTAPGIKRSNAVFGSTLPTGVRVGSNPNIQRNYLVSGGKFDTPTNIVTKKVGLQGQLKLPSRDMGLYAKGSFGLQSDNTSQKQTKPYASAEFGFDLVDKLRMMKNSGKLRKMSGLPNNFKVTPSFGFNIAGNNFKTGDYGMNKNIISGASNYYANITAQQQLGKNSWGTLGIGASTAAGPMVSFGYKRNIGR
jgi:hypothetical protein